MVDAPGRPDATRVPAHNPDAMRASGCATLVLLIPFLGLTSFFTIGGANLVLHGEPAALPFVLGSGYTQIAVVVLVWVTRSVGRTLDAQGTVTQRSVRRAHRALREIRTGCFVVVALLAAIAAFTVLVGVDDDGSPVVLGLMLVPAALMAVLLLFLARAVRRLCRVYETHYPGLPSEGKR